MALKRAVRSEEPSYMYLCPISAQNVIFSDFCDGFEKQKGPFWSPRSEWFFLAKMEDLDPMLVTSMRNAGHA